MRCRSTPTSKVRTPQAMPRLRRTASRYSSPPDSFGGRGGFESTLSNSFSGGPSESKRSISTPAPVSIEAFYEGRAAASTAPLRLKRAEKRQDRGTPSIRRPACSSGPLPSEWIVAGSSPPLQAGQTGRLGRQAGLLLVGGKCGRMRWEYESAA